MKVGLLGGSFNPVHNGHLRLAMEVLEQGGLDRVEIIPASVPPHKDQGQIRDFRFRCRLIELAIAGQPGLELNTMEGRRSGPSYTADTLTLYRRLYPDREPHFIIGCADFLQLPKWHAWEQLVQLAHFVIVPRDEGDHADLAGFIRSTWPQAIGDDQGSWTMPSGWKIWSIDIPRLEISSSLIRGKMARGRDIRYLVPDPVWEVLAGSDPAQTGSNS